MEGVIAPSMSTGSLYNTRNANARRYFSTILPIPIQLPKYNLFSSPLTLFRIEGLFSHTSLSRLSSSDYLLVLPPNFSVRFPT